MFSLFLLFLVLAQGEECGSIHVGVIPLNLLLAEQSQHSAFQHRQKSVNVKSSADVQYGESGVYLIIIMKVDTFTLFLFPDHLNHYEEDQENGDQAFSFLFSLIFYYPLCM